MLGPKPKAQVEEKDHDEDKSEVLGNLVKVVVLIWSASLLTFSYVRLPNGQKILDFDPTFIAQCFWIFSCVRIESCQIWWYCKW